LGTDPLSGYNPVMESEHYIDGQHNSGVFNSFNLNTYIYCYQNPVLFVDPDGKQTLGQTVSKGLGRGVIADGIGFIIDIPTNVLGALLKSQPLNGGEAKWIEEKAKKDANRVLKSESDSQPKDGAERAEKYGEGWSEGSLKETRNKVAPNSEGEPNDKGDKTIYKNDKTGKQVVYDKKGNYYRVEDTNLSGKRKYLDKNGNPVSNNKTINGKQRGKTQAEYNQETHYKNIDK
jgi:hypothetical protein